MRHAVVATGAVAISVAATRELLHRPADGKLVVVATVTLSAVALVLKWLPFGPGLIVAATGLLPYPVAFVGKTPFGVVTAAGALAVALALAVAWYVDQRAVSRLPPEAGIRLLLLWLAWAAVSAATSAYPRVSLNDVREVLFAMPLAYLAGRAIASRHARVLVWCLAGVTFVAALGVLQGFTGFSPARLLPRAGHFPLTDPGEAYRFGRVRVRAGYYHASDLGRVLAVALPFLLVEGLRRGAARWLRFSLGLVVVALGLTLTFTVWVAAAVGVGVLVLANPATRRQAVAAAAVIVLAISLGLGGSVLQLTQSRLHPTGNSKAEQDLRLALVPASVDYADHHRLLGAGPGAFDLLNLNYPVQGVRTPLIDDSTFTTSLIEEGWPGALLLAGGLVVLVGSLWRRRRNPLHAAVLASLCAWLVAALTIDALARDAPLLACWLLLGAGAGAAVTLPGAAPAASGSLAEPAAAASA